MVEPHKRRRKELIQLRDYFKELNFFKKLPTEEGDDIAKYRYLKPWYLRQNDLVFNYGDEGSWFYIVIQGWVGVKVPNMMNLEMTPPKLIKFLNDNRKDVILERSHFHIDISKNKNDDLFEFIQTQLQNANQEEVKSYDICILKEVAQLSEGSSFGELSLLESQPRSATIYCKTKEWFFAILERKDF